MFSSKFIDKCASTTLNDCHEDAICTTVAGGYVCNCKSGFVGDGKNCSEGK